MIFYTWIALTDSEWMEWREATDDWSNASGAMGITDDRNRAMQAGAEALVSGRAGVVIIEAVRPAMTGHTLAPCYLKTGISWSGRCTYTGKVIWHRFFRRDSPGPTADANPRRLFDPAGDPGPDDSRGPAGEPPGRIGP